MGKQLKLAWRNVWRNWRRTLIALLAIALGLILVLISNGILDGSEKAAFGNAVRLQGGNVQVHAAGYRQKAKWMPLYPLKDANIAVQTALTQPMATAATRRINTSGLISNREGALPVVITGIEPEREAPVGLLAENITGGRYLVESDEDMILIGRGLADQLEVGVGDRLTLVGSATHKQMRRRTMTVVGVYDLGLPEVEKGLVYISLLEAQTLFDLRDQATEVGVFLQSVGQEQETVAALQALLPDYEVDSWESLNPEMKTAMNTMGQVMGAIDVVVLLIAGVGVLNLMLMAVFERTREIGLLAAMGLKRRNIMTLFLLEGALIGFLGASIGCTAGMLIVEGLGKMGLDLTSASGMGEMTALIGGRLFPDIEIGLAVSRGLIVLVIATLASLYPAWRASRQEPAQVLHAV